MLKLIQIFQGNPGRAAMGSPQRRHPTSGMTSPTYSKGSDSNSYKVITINSATDQVLATDNSFDLVGSLIGSVTDS